MTVFKAFRIFVLLAVLFVVGLNEWRAQSMVTAWDKTLYVGIFPLNPDNSPAVAEYIATLEPSHFAVIEKFFAEEMVRYGMPRKPALNVRVGPSISELPPKLANRPNMFETIIWSLRLRWWAWRNTPKLPRQPEILLYVMYHDPLNTERVPTSHGLQKGRLGIVQAFSGRDMDGTTAFIATHELLHTLGATDKYERTGEPRWPDGYAIPDAQPRYPQKYAEVMGGRIPLSAAKSELPMALWQGLIGEQTAREIGWLKP